MSVGEWFLVVLAALTFVTGMYFSVRGLLSTARTERRSEAQRHHDEIAAARAEERALCEQRAAGLLRERDDIARERDLAVAQRDALQILFNQLSIRRDQ